MQKGAVQSNCNGSVEICRLLFAQCINDDGHQQSLVTNQDDRHQQSLATTQNYGHHQSLATTQDDWHQQFLATLEANTNVQIDSCLSEDEVPPNVSSCQSILFSGFAHIYYGFFKLFNKFELSKNAEEASILVVPVYSLCTGEVQDMETYDVKIVEDYGEVNKKEKYSPVVLQLKGKH